jgi:glycosyltransferase involved in cell wall biosynthesis
MPWTGTGRRLHVLRTKFCRQSISVSFRYPASKAIRVSSFIGAVHDHLTFGNPDVSVVILTKNCGRSLARCLDSVVAENPGEILAVDGFSTDETLRILKDYDVKILRESNDSLGYCRQLGVTAAEGDYVMFVDSDVELGKGCITTMRSELRKHGWVGIHARFLSRENSTYWQRAEDEAFSLCRNHVGPTKWIATGAALFRREVLLKHPFDPSMRAASEDRDLSHRLTQSSYCLGVSSAVAYHRHRRETRAFAKQRFRYGVGDARFYLKYKSIGELTNPFQSSVYFSIYCLVTNRVRLIPYWLVAGIFVFLGLLVGLSRAQHPSHGCSNGYVGTTTCGTTACP